MGIELATFMLQFLQLCCSYAVVLCSIVILLSYSMVLCPHNVVQDIVDIAIENQTCASYTNYRNLYQHCNSSREQLLCNCYCITTVFLNSFKESHIELKETTLEVLPAKVSSRKLKTSSASQKVIQ